MKSNRPNLNKQDTSVPLKLFNWDFIAFKFKVFFVFFFYINFPKSNNICSWVLLCCKYYWIWVRIFQIFYIDSQSDFICTESILFRLCGFDPSVFSIYFISFFVPAQNQLFSLPLFFFAHLILSMLGFICFFTFCRCIVDCFCKWLRFWCFIWLWIRLWVCFKSVM